MGWAGGGASIGAHWARARQDGIKVSAHVRPEPTDESLRHLQQMGVTHCYAWVEEAQCNAPFLTALRENIESYGITLWNCGCMRWAKNKDIILNTSERDSGIDGFNQMLRDLAAAGIGITTFTWSAHRPPPPFTAP